MKAIAKRKHETKAAGRTSKDLGRLGEKMAVRFLRSRGYNIFKNNYSCPLGEIDIVAEHGNCLVFVEVKTRTSERFGPPLSSITWQKERHIIRNCLFYLKRHSAMDRLWRIDVIGIMLSSEGKLETLEHVKNAVIVQ